MPNRILKESIRTSKTVNAMTDFQFRVWAYLITYVDDYGRGSADAELLKGFLFPRRKRVTEADISKSLADLAGMGCILLYEVDGESYLCFPKWSDHQRVQQKRSKFPEPPPDVTSRWVTVGHGEPPPESNPIQSEYESISESEYESEEQPPAGGERIDYAGIAESFNRICVSLPHVETITDQRRKAIRGAVKQVERVGGFEYLFRRVEDSDFLTGRSGNWSRCGFDWILKPANLTKILEGNYDNRQTATRAKGITQIDGSSLDLDAYEESIRDYIPVYKDEGGST